MCIVMRGRLDESRPLSDIKQSVSPYEFPAYAFKYIFAYIFCIFS